MKKLDFIEFDEYLSDESNDVDCESQDSRSQEERRNERTTIRNSWNNSEQEKRSAKRKGEDSAGDRVSNLANVFKEINSHESNDGALSATQESLGRPSSQFNEVELSITIARRGSDCPLEWICRAAKFLHYYAAKGAIAVERGGQRGHIHGQGVMRIAYPANQLTKLRNFMKTKLQMRRGTMGTVSLKLIDAKSTQSFMGTLGYCQKDYGRRHFVMFLSNIGADMAFEAYQRYASLSAFSDHREKIDKRNVFHLCKKFYEDHLQPLEVSLPQVLHYMILSGDYCPGVEWGLSSRGEALDVQRAAALFRISTLGIEDISPEDTMLVFFNNKKKAQVQDEVRSDSSTTGDQYTLESLTENLSSTYEQFEEDIAQAMRLRESSERTPVFSRVKERTQACAHDVAKVDFSTYLPGPFHESDILHPNHDEYVKAKLKEDGQNQTKRKTNAGRSKGGKEKATKPVSNHANATGLSSDEDSQAETTRQGRSPTAVGLSSGKRRKSSSKVQQLEQVEESSDEQSSSSDEGLPRFRKTKRNANTSRLQLSQEEKKARVVISDDSDDERPQKRAKARMSSTSPGSQPKITGKGATSVRKGRTQNARRPATKSQRKQKEVLDDSDDELMQPKPKAAPSDKRDEVFVVPTDNQTQNQIRDSAMSVTPAGIVTRGFAHRRK